MELDAPCSWGQQALKYARRNDLPRDVLEEAFASTENIQLFRRSLDMPYAVARDAINLLNGGAGIVKMCSVLPSGADGRAHAFVSVRIHK